MFRIRILILFSLIVSCSLAQENIFGVYWKKYFNSKDTIFYRKVGCLPNKFFTHAEVFNKAKCLEQYIVFKNYYPSASIDNNQIKELCELISKSFAEATYYCLNKSQNEKMIKEYYWVLKSNDGHIVLKLFLDSDINMINFRAIYFKNSKLFTEGMHKLMYNENKEVGVVSKNAK